MDAIYEKAKKFEQIYRTENNQYVLLNSRKLIDGFIAGYKQALEDLGIVEKKITQENKQYDK